MLDPRLKRDAASAVNARIGALLHLAQRRSAFHLSAALTATNVTIAQAEALVSLAGFDDGVEQHLLARAIGMDRSTVSELIVGLEARSLVVPFIGNDRRHKLLHLTASGKQHIQTAAAAMAAGNRNFVADTGIDEAILSDLLTPIAGGPSPAPIHAAPRSRPAFLQGSHFLLRRASQVAGALFEQEAQSFETRPFEVTILTILTLGSALSVSDLQEITGTARSVATPSIRRLAARNLVTRVQNPADRRGALLSITQEGHHHFASLRAPIERYETRLLAPLATPFQDGLRALLLDIAVSAQRVIP